MLFFVKSGHNIAVKDRIVRLYRKESKGNMFW